MEFRVQYEVTNEQKCSKYIPQNCRNCITHILILFHLILNDLHLFGLSSVVDTFCDIFPANFKATLFNDSALYGHL